MKALRYVGKNGCRDKRYSSALAEPPDDLVILDLASKKPNITLRATIDEQPLLLRTSWTRSRHAKIATTIGAVNSTALFR